MISAASGREAVIGALAPGLTLGLLHALTVFFPDVLELPILLKLGDNISTDTISPAGARALPFRSNIAQIAKFSYDIVDGTYHDRAMAVHTQGGHAIVGGRNYGQGSSREHAALAPRSLGLHLVVAKGMARIHWQNLVNFGVLPLIFMDPADYDRLWQGDVIRVEGINAAIKSDPTIPVKNLTMKLTFVARHGLSDRQDRRRARGRGVDDKTQGRASTSATRKGFRSSSFERLPHQIAQGILRGLRQATRASLRAEATSSAITSLPMTS